eukprot:s1452_g15.t1
MTGPRHERPRPCRQRSNSKAKVVKSQSVTPPFQAGQFLSTQDFHGKGLARQIQPKEPGWRSCCSCRGRFHLPVGLGAAGVLASAARARFQRNLGARQRRSTLRRHAVDALDAGTGIPKEFGEWCALYINLDRRQDRKEKLLKLLAKQNGPLLARLERVQAIDKQNLSLDDEIVVNAVAPHALERTRRAMEEDHYTIVHDEEGNLVHFDDHLTLGGIACALSHRLALQRYSNASGLWQTGGCFRRPLNAQSYLVGHKHQLRQSVPL